MQCHPRSDAPGTRWSAGISMAEIAKRVEVGASAIAMAIKRKMSLDEQQL